MKEWLGKTVDAEDLERHDKWLCMMWPRLQLLKELLSEGGLLLIS
jgi:adenine-specific DNA-methyltransferase